MKKISGAKAIEKYGIEAHEIEQAVKAGKIEVFSPGFKEVEGVPQNIKLDKEHVGRGNPHTMEVCLFYEADIEALKIGDETATGFTEMATYINELDLDTDRGRLKEWNRNNKYGFKDLLSEASKKRVSLQEKIEVKKILLYRWVIAFKHVLPKN